MPTQDKVLKTWKGRVRLKGFPIKEKRGFRTKTEAKDWETETKRLTLNPEQAYQGYSFSQVADLWLFSCQKRFKRTTCRDKAYIINKAMEFWGYDPVMSKITTLSIEEFLNTLPGKTANRYKREINTFFNFAIFLPKIYRVRL